jgi:hypothetical protein
MENGKRQFQRLREETKPMTSVTLVLLLALVGLATMIDLLILRPFGNTALQENEERGARSWELVVDDARPLTL